MRATDRRPRCWRAVLLAVVAASFVHGVAAAEGGATGAVLVAPPSVDPLLEPVAEGLREWLRLRLGRAAVPAVAREALRPHTPESRADALSPAQLVAVAGKLGAARLVIPDVRLTSSQVEVRLRLYDVAASRLVGVPRAMAPLADVGQACEEAAVALLAFLGRAGRPGPPPQLDDLAAAGRALLLRDRGELFHAWREVERKLSPTAVAVRKDIVAAALSAPGAAGDRARVLAAAGHGARAWPLIRQDVTRALDDPDPDVELLLAAAEIELAQTNPREARRYVDKLLETRSGSAEVQRTYARILLEQNDPQGARQALRRAVKLDPSDPRTFERLADLETADRERRAELLLRAGQSEATRFDPHRASTLLDKAAQAGPRFAVESWLSRGALEQTLGRPAESLTAYRKAADADSGNAAAHRGIGDASSALGDTASAERAYQRALELAPDDADALNGLGAVYVKRNQPREAVPLLRRSLALEPEDAAKRRNLAQALRATGDLERALTTLVGEKSELPVRSPESLRLAAELQTELGRHAEARDTLRRAAELDPFDPEIQARLAAAYAASGDAESARRARELTALLRGEAPEVEPRTQTRAAAAEATADGPALDGLVQSFASTLPGSEERNVVQLGIRDTPTWRSRLVTWLHPRRPDWERIEGALDRAIAGSFALLAAPDFENPVFAERIDRLYAFEERSSLDAGAVADVNQTLGTHAVFVARLNRAPEPVEDAAVSGACADPGRFELEVRMLTGSDPAVVSIHGNHECIEAGMRDFGTWNERALAIYAVVLLIVLFPVLRGWARVEVNIKLPPKTKGFFAIRISKSEDDIPTEKKKAADSGRLKRSLRSLSRFERQMAGRRTLFRWIPARKRGYYVTVKGPLMDATGQEIIGHFLETQKVKTARGKTTTLEYDFRPKECGVEIQVLLDGDPAQGARIALRGQAASIRYARAGSAVIPLPAGTHQVLVGAGDRVAEYEVRVESLGRSIHLLADLSEEHCLVFQGCPEAVESYLAGDYRTAADALAASGLTHEAHRARAEHMRLRGSTDEAAAELEAAGEFEAAAQLRAEGEDMTGSAALFERAGDHGRAADAYRAAGATAEAARCYEAAYDYDNALECYREIGDDGKALEILEKTGEFFEAGRLAAELGEADRALVDLQQLDARDPAYGEACQLVADILESRGDFDVAADKLEEALRCAGNNASAALHERFADLLVKAGRADRAIDAYQTVRRIDPQRRDLSERIAELEAARGGAPPAPGRTESRYEILGELGRGAMGVVFKARDKNLGRIVALKRLPDNLRDHPTAIALFRREAQAAAALNHRNIVTLFDAGEENDSYFITMELLEGLPLNQILKKKGRLGTGDTLRLGVQIAAGLHYAHEQRIVHRDIKAGNLFFTRDRTVKIMDFGLAKTIEEVRKSSTMIGGTPYYMAPEQAAGEELDHRADLYAFGVTLYQLLTGTVPFREGDLAYHHRHTAPPDPRTHVAEIPGPLAELILQMLAKAPADRPTDAGEIGRRLQAIFNALKADR